MSGRPSDTGQGLFAGRVALIYGGGRGIGAACAKGLAEGGADISVVSRTVGEAQMVCEVAQGSGVQAEAIRADLGDPDQILHSVERTMGRFGRIDLVINLVADTGPLNVATWEVSEADWRSVLAVNISAPYAIARLVVPIMLQQAHGKLLFATSPFGDRVTPGMGGYGCSRAAVNHLVLQLGAELQGSTVAACLVYPGITDTPGLRSFRERHHAGGPSLPFASAVHPEDMARLFLWTCLQPPASINGAVIAWSDPQVQAALRVFWSERTGRW